MAGREGKTHTEARRDGGTEGKLFLAQKEEKVEKVGVGGEMVHAVARRRGEKMRRKVRLQSMVVECN